MVLLVATLAALLQLEGGGDGAQRLAHGKELFLQGSYPEAVAELRGAIPRLDEAADRLEAHLTLALIHQARAEDERTLIELQWALVEDASLALDPDLYSPKTRAMLDRAREGAFERLLTAKKDFTSGELGLALEEFRLAAALLSRDAESENEQTENVLDALLSAALIEQTLGDEAAAKGLFRRALSLRPALSLDETFYSPSTLGLFVQVKDEAADVLARARRAVGDGRIDEAESILASGRENLYAPGQKLEARVLTALGAFTAGDRERARSELTSALSEQPGLELDASLYGSDFRGFAESVRVVATRGIPRIAIVQSSASAVHEAAREGFEEVTLAEIETYVLPEDADAAGEASSADLVFVLGAEALERVMDCCAGVPRIAANLPAGASYESTGATPTGGVPWNVTVSAQIPVALRALPSMRRVGIVVGSDGGESLAAELRRGLEPYGIELVTREARSEDEVRRQVEAILSDIDLFWYLPDPVLASVSTFESVLEACASARTPVFAFHESLVRAGAYAGVSADFRGVGRRAGRMATAYLGGRSAEALEVVPADASRVVLNLRAAARLGIDPDPTLVSLAATVYR